MTISVQGLVGSTLAVPNLPFGVTDVTLTADVPGSTTAVSSHLILFTSIADASSTSDCSIKSAVDDATGGSASGYYNTINYVCFGAGGNYVTAGLPINGRDSISPYLVLRPIATGEVLRVVTQQGSVASPVTLAYAAVVAVTGLKVPNGLTDPCAQQCPNVDIVNLGGSYFDVGGGTATISQTVGTSTGLLAQLVTAQDGAGITSFGFTNGATILDSFYDQSSLNLSAAIACEVAAGASVDIGGTFDAATDAANGGIHAAALNSREASVGAGVHVCSVQSVPVFDNFFRMA